MCEMHTWRKAKHIHKRQTRRQRAYYVRAITAKVQLKKKISDSGTEGAWRQDEMIGGNPSVV
jgi:hypothetical protein